MSRVRDEINSDTVHEPYFPPEIEYQIFAFAIYGDTAGRTHLLIVAKRVFEWLIPLLYETIIMEDNIPYPSVECFREYGHHVRTLCMFDLSSDPEDDIDILSSCIHVSRLAYLHQDHRTEVLRLPLTELSARDPRYLKFLVDTSTTTPNVHVIDGITQSWCSNITHLSILWDNDTPRTIFSAFPSLTHFRSFEYGDSRAVQYVLDNCSRLEVLIWTLDPGDYSPNYTIIPAMALPFTDIRVVRMVGYILDDWDVVVKRETMWVTAEREIERRKSQMARSSDTQA